MSIIEDAQMMEDAGAVALLLEALPTEVAKVIAESTELPVIGIVSGPHCDGQVLVMHDMLGYGAGHPPRSAKQYARLHDQVLDAYRSFAKEVAEGAFPTAANSVAMEPSEWEELSKKIAAKKFF
jgi:3-methyl-2-oxobutanoate hydroxymethyltransferase